MADHPVGVEVVGPVLWVEGWSLVGLHLPVARLGHCLAAVGAELLLPLLEVVLPGLGWNLAAGAPVGGPAGLWPTQALWVCSACRPHEGSSSRLVQLLCLDSCWSPLP